MNTALIIHPDFPHQPLRPRLGLRFGPPFDDRCLELHGPDPEYSFSVRRFNGHFLSYPDCDYGTIHPQRAPRIEDGSEIERLAAKRVIALVDQALETNSISFRQLREIRWRTVISQPYCEEEW